MPETPALSREVCTPVSDEFIGALTRALADRGFLAYLWDGESLPNLVDTGLATEQ